MAISSMTGHGEAAGAAGPLAWRFEIRSVNHRGLDLRLRLPPGAESLDGIVRSAVRGAVRRGSLTVSLQVSWTDASTAIRIDPEALDAVLGAVEAIRVRLSAPALAPETIDPLRLLSVRGVLETTDQPQIPPSALETMIPTLHEALAGLVANRVAEGTRLAALLASQVDTIEALTAEAERSPARAPEAIRERLAKAVARLAEVDMLDSDRLHQEAILLATRADIREELDRLRGHVAAARDLYEGDEPVGRRLDFLAQEFNREANTLCSKSNDADVTRIGLELKVIIDQMREQVQNIE